MKKGIFPYLPEGMQITDVNAFWDGDSGIVKLNAAGIGVTFDKSRYNDPLNGKPSIESGTMIFCQNSGNSTSTATITDGQLGDTTGAGATTSLAAGESVTVLYLEEHGFVFLGQLG